MTVPRTIALTPRKLLVALALIGSTPVHGEQGSFSGELEVGLRQVDVQGDDAKYRQHVNLNNGPFLERLSISLQPGGESDGRQALAPDELRLEASGLGDEPHGHLDLALRKYGRYQFRYRHSASDYFYQDVLFRPAEENANSSIGGDFHHWDFERTRDSASLDVALTERAQLSLSHERYQRDGDSTTVVDVLREEFEMEQPLDETWRSTSVAFTYRWDAATVQFTESWADHDNDYRWLLTEFSAGSAPGAPTALDRFLLDQPYQQDVRTHGFKVTARPMDGLDLYVNAQQIDADMDLDVRERSAGVSFDSSPFVRDERGQGGADRDTLLLDTGASYALTERLAVGAGLRRYRLEQDGAVRFDGEDARSDWEIESTAWELSLQTALNRAWTVTLGWHAERRDTDMVELGAGFALRSDERTDHDGLFAQAVYRPSKQLRVTLAAEDNRIDDPYTAASATDAQRYRVEGRLSFDNGFSVLASHRYTDYENDNSDWRAKTNQSELRLAYSGPTFTVAAGAAWVEVERDLEQLVSAGTRSVLFPIHYDADASFWDLSASYQLTERLGARAYWRNYRNDGSFDVRRDDLQMALHYALSDTYALTASYRNVDFTEGHIEAFDADLWQLGLRVNW